MTSSSVVKSKVSSTNKKIDQIYKSLGIYLINNRRLPCPASLVRGINDDELFGEEVRLSSGICGGSAGVFDSTISTNIKYGMVPIKALNLSSDYAIDDFGNKISYIIDQRFTGDFQETGMNSSMSSFGTVPANPENEIIKIKEMQINGSSEIDILKNSILVILSHGPNGLGSFNANDSTQNISSSDLAEVGNSYSASFDNVFYSESFNSDKFDDIILFKNRNDFIKDFSLQNLIPCFSDDVTDVSFTPTSLYNGQYLYANSDCNSVSENVVRKTLKCNYNGEWQWVVQSCP